ncbi:MAG: c-type cytochrome [Anaerolineales bacterium]|nr:MAG: c-type cytochrome [Anaerolineales bacterium]WKZ40430.1 MAG: c-type cytochrome [Anaerolineales bacterium]
MNRSELISRILVYAGVVLVIGAPLVFWARTPLIHARMPEYGGWSPNIIHANVGEPLHLKLTSDDVVHGFAVGQMDMQSVDILPGKVTDITLKFDKPGIYTFYCTRWCGLNHWRMRGTIEVSGSPSDSEPASPPLYVSLNLDIDAPHDAPVVPAQKPSAIRGQGLIPNSPFLQSFDYYRSNSPYQAFLDLSNTSLTEPQRWDVVAFIWRSNTLSESLANGKQLYAQNCAACHGENGAGDGVFADDLTTAGESSMQTMEGAMDMIMQSPVDFTDPQRMLGASPALLQGKILRGGMGTGMPMWGSIFTEEQIWDLIAYIYSFQFEYQN